MQTRSRKNQGPPPSPAPAPAARPKARSKSSAPEPEPPAKPERPIDAKLSVVPGAVLPSEFSSVMDAYSFYRIMSYFRKTPRGLRMTEAQLESLTGADFQDVDFWLEPGTCCTDFVTLRNEVGRPIRSATRVLIQITTSVEILHERVYQHGTVCIHAAVPPLGAVERDNATQWLVSIVDASGATMWPPTWICDDFDSLVSHASRPYSQDWTNTHPLEMNLAPAVLFDVPRPMVRIVGIESARADNLPFSFWLRCEISDGRGGYSEARLCRPDLVECFSHCWTQVKRRPAAEGPFFQARWRSYEICFPRVEPPSSQTMKNPFHWRRLCNELDEQRRGEAVDEEPAVPAKLRSTDPQVAALQANHFKNFVHRRDNTQLTDSDFNDFHNRYPNMPVLTQARSFRF